MKSIYSIIIFVLALFTIHQRAEAEVTYIHSDYLGSVVAKSNSNGQVTTFFNYLPFGMPVNSNTSQMDNEQTYTGHVYDDELDLNYMQARYYDPVIGRFYSNDPVDVLSHISRGNTIHGFGRYTYANNNPHKFVDPDGEFGVVGFIIGFVADAGVQYATTGKVDVQQSFISGAVGAVTGGLTSIAKSSLTVGGKVVASQGEKIAASGMILTGSAAAGGGGHAINESLNGETASVGETVVNGVLSAAGPGKQVGNAVGKIAEAVKDTIGSAGGGAGDIAVQATAEVAGKAVDEAIKSDE